MSGPNPIRILLAEDDDDHVVLTRRALRDYPRPIDLTVVRDGSEALARLEMGLCPHVLLLDLHMPRMTGFQVVAAIRADESLAGLPVVILSASVTSNDHGLAVEKGATAFLPKSSSMRDFAAGLARLLDALVPDQGAE